MTVFKGYLKGALRQRSVILLYLLIFLGLGTLMTMSMDESGSGQYEAEQIRMAVIDRDHSALSEGLKTYLGQSQELVEPEDKKEVLQEELYYGNIEYVLVIPEGFEAAFTEQTANDSAETEAASADSRAETEAASADDGSTASDGLLEGTGRPGSTESYYAKELAEGYLSGAALYLKAGYTAKEAADAMAELETTGVKAVYAEGSSEMSRLAGTFQYLPYVLTALSCYVIGFVMLDYQRPEIRARLAVSAVSFRKRLAMMLLAFLVIGAAFYGVSMLLVAAMSKGALFTDGNLGYYALNTLTMVLVGLSIAFLVVHVAGTANGVNGLANVIALGMSFLCGVFIPDSMLSSSVRRIARFLPVYWYEQNNQILGTHTELGQTLVNRLMTGYLRQLLFAAVVLVLAMGLKKWKEK